MKEKVAEIMNDLTSEMNQKERIKFYMQLTEETITKSTDLILLERCKTDLKNLENTFLELLSKEYCFQFVDRNN